MNSSEYQSRLLREISKVKLDVGPGEWYDYWHVHLDLNWGEGNRSKANRRICARAHIALFTRLVRQARHFQGPWQCWVMIFTKNSWEDCVFFHTPNPNKDNFPVDFSFVKWGIPIPPLLKGLVDVSEQEIGRVKYKRFPVYVIRMK